MSFLSFLAQIIDSLAWPVTLLLALHFLREPLALLIPQTQKVKFRDLEIDFGQQIHELQRQAEENLPANIDETRNVAVDRRMYELTRVSPTMAVLESWKVVTRSARRLLHSKEIAVPDQGPQRFKDLEEALVASTLVDQRTQKLFTDLRRLRNKVAHARGFEVDIEHASEYVDVALKLAAYMDGLRRQTG